MTQTEALQAHRRLCDELHQLALEENRFLKEHRQLPPPALLERKRALITRLDTSLAALREAPPARPGDDERRALIEKAREKILQILHLDRENEQLMLRYTLSRPGHAPRASAIAPVAPATDAYGPASAAAPTVPPAATADATAVPPAAAAPTVPSAATAAALAIPPPKPDAPPAPPAPAGSLSQLQRLYDRLR